MKFKIKLHEIDTIINAKNEDEAYSIAIDIVNDIGKYGNYDLIEVKKCSNDKQI